MCHMLPFGAQPSANRSYIYNTISSEITDILVSVLLVWLGMEPPALNPYPAVTVYIMWTQSISSKMFSACHPD